MARPRPELPLRPERESSPRKNRSKPDDRQHTEEVDQHEVVYHFASFALGVIGGVTIEPLWLAPALMAS